jgi:hypothetical protein
MIYCVLLSQVTTKLYGFWLGESATCLEAFDTTPLHAVSQVDDMTTFLLSNHPVQDCFLYGLCAFLCFLSYKLSYCYFMATGRFAKVDAESTGILMGVLFKKFHLFSYTVVIVSD